MKRFIALAAIAAGLILFASPDDPARVVERPLVAASPPTSELADVKEEVAKLKLQVAELKRRMDEASAVSGPCKDNCKCASGGACSCSGGACVCKACTCKNVPEVKPVVKPVEAPVQTFYSDSCASGACSSRRGLFRRR